MPWWGRLLGRDPGDAAQAPLRFDTDGWTRGRRANDAQEWTDPLGNTLRLEVASGPAPYLTTATDLAGLRDWCRQDAAGRDGGIVSVDLVNVGGRQGLQIITKFERRPSYVYEGTLVVPLRDAHGRLVVLAREHGMTGMREAVITNHLLSLDELDLRSVSTSGESEDGAPIPGWVKDPYDAVDVGRPVRSLADDPRVDAVFPDHPLSRVRTTLATMRATMEFKEVGDADADQTLSFASSGEEGRTSHEMSGGAVGSLLLAMNRAADAQAVLEESVKRHAAHAGADPARVATEWQWLGFAHEAQGQTEGAEAAFLEAATRFAAAMGERHLRTAQAINNRARMLLARMDAAGAEPLFRFALDVFESEGADRSDAAIALNGLGLVHIARERYTEALDCFERAVGIFERVHGPAFPDIATVLRNMALAWKRLGNPQRMADAWRRAESVEQSAKTAAPVH